MSPEHPSNSVARNARLLAANRGDQRFGRSQRLLATADFDAVFAHAQRSSDRYFTILFNANTLQEPRLGFAISKQRVRRAVDRNRLRRLVRESFRVRAKSLPPFDLVVLARDATSGAAQQDLWASLTRHWTQIENKANHSEGSSHT